MLHEFNILAQDPPTLWSIITWMGWTAAVSVGVYYVTQALFGSDLKEAEPSEDSRSRMWDPHTTQTEGLVRARCYGRNMHEGNIIAKWTDVDGDEREILYLLLDHGDGPTQGNVAGQLFLNGQPYDNMGSVVVQERRGTFDQSCMDGFEKTKLEYVVNQELLKADEGDPYVYTTHKNFFNDIEYTICFPNGLMKYRVNGATTNWSVHLQVRISEHDADDWTILFDGNITRQQTKPLFLKYLVSEQGFQCERGKLYDLEYTRTTVDGHVRRLDKSFLRSVREVVDIPFTHPGKAMTGIKAIATSLLSGKIEVQVIREDRLVNVYNGSTWSIQYTRNLAWIVYDLMTRPVISGNGAGIAYAVERYDGVNPADMDLEFFYNWASFCEVQCLDGYGDTEDRLACDLKVDSRTNVWDLVKDLAEIGRAKIYWSGSTLTGWIDKAVTGTSDLVTMNTIMARTWKNRWIGKAELAGTVEVFYHDNRLGYERTHVPFSNSAAGRYTRVIAIEGIGVKTYGNAVRIANHALKRNQLIKNINSFREFKDAFLHKLGDVIRVQHKVPGWGQGFKVVDVPTNQTCILDRYCNAAAGELVYVRAFDAAGGTVDVSVYTVASAVGTLLTIVETWDITPARGNNLAIGVDGQIVARRITRIEPTVDNYFDVTVETYDANLYTADDIDPDAPNKEYSWSAPPGALAQPVSRDDVLDLIDNILPPQPDIEVPWLSNCEWSGNSVDTVSWAKRDADEEITFRYRGVDYEIDPDNTTDEFIYWDPDFSTTFKTTNLVSVATAAGNWYMCRNIDGVAYPANSMMIAQVGVLLAGFLKVGTADIEDLAVITLKIQDNAVTLPVSSYTAGSIGFGSETTIQSLSFTSTGQPLYIQFSAGFTSSMSVSVHNLTLRIYRDTTKIYEITLPVPSLGVSFSLAGLYGFNFSESPGAGTYTYYIKAVTTIPGAQAKNRSLYIHELKK